MSDYDALDKAATPAPWGVMLGSGDHLCTGISHEDSDTGDVTWIADCWPDWMVPLKADHVPDMRLIVALRNAYAEGILIPRSHLEAAVKAGVEAGVSAAEAAGLIYSSEYVAVLRKERDILLAEHRAGDIDYECYCRFHAAASRYYAALTPQEVDDAANE